LRKRQSVAVIGFAGVGSVNDAHEHAAIEPARTAASTAADDRASAAEIKVRVECGVAFGAVKATLEIGGSGGEEVSGSVTAVDEGGPL